MFMDIVEEAVNIEEGERLETRDLYGNNQEIDLLALLFGVWKGLYRLWWMLIILAILFGGIFVFYAHKRYYPMYKAEATFTVMLESDSQSGVYGFYYDSSTADQLEKTFPYILGTELLTDAIKADLNVTSVNAAISASGLEGSNMITMTVIGSNKDETKQILESAIRVYPTVARIVVGNVKFNMLSVPSVSDEPYNQPNYKRTAAKGTLVGIGAGILIIVLYAFFKKTIQHADELKQVSSMECLEQIPKMRKQKMPFSIVDEAAREDFKECFKVISVRFERAMEEVSGNVVMVTSTVAGEGKSTVCGNLAMILSLLGKKVLWIDGDLRKQQDYQMIASGQYHNMKEIMMYGKNKIESIARDEKSRVYFIGGDQPVHDIQSVLNSSEFQATMEELKKQFDYVFVDTPPLELFDDAEVISEYVDGILFVVRHNFTEKRKILDSLAVLGDTKAKLLGFIYNGDENRYFRYGYGKYGYGKYGYGKYRYGEDVE